MSSEFSNRLTAEQQHLRPGGDIKAVVGSLWDTLVLYTTLKRSVCMLMAQLTLRRELR
jgi:hypothetical protein